VTLDNNTNYIVSGIERSGTSMLMQIIHNSGAPMSYDHDTRPPDKNNPKGYFELEGGKIINKLMDGSFPYEDFKGKFIKITAYGMKFLPKGSYKVIYSERNIDEILDSMEKMAKIKDENREKTRKIFIKLNNMTRTLISGREDINVLFVSYNDILNNPEENIKAIYDFLDDPELDLDKMIGTVDKSLHRNIR
jgi:hypothetical protein